MSNLTRIQPQVSLIIIRCLSGCVIRISGVPRMCLWNFSSKYPTDHLLCHFEYACFEWKQKQLFFPCASTFKCKWAAAPFSITGLCLYSLYFKYSDKKHLKTCVLSHISLNFWYMFFWAQTSEAQKAAVIGTTKLRSLSYLTVLKLSNTHKFMLTTHISYKK